MAENSCPEIPVLLETSQADDELIPEAVVDIVTENYFRMAHHIKDLRVIANCK